MLRRVGGWCRAADLASVCGRTAVERALARGEVVRVARGRYALAALPDPWTSAARLGGVVSHTSAARFWRLAVLNHPDQAHVTLTRSRSRVAAAGAVLHWSKLHEADVHMRLPVTAPLRTVLDCARTLPFGEALATADSALKARVIHEEELRRAAANLRGPGARRARRVATWADGRAESGLESMLRAIFVDHRIRSFTPQYVIRDDSGFVARVDLAHPVRRLVAEADSFQHHGHRTALVRDCERYDELFVRGWGVLRFAWEHVMFRPDWVAAIVKAAVGRSSRANMRNAA